MYLVDGSNEKISIMLRDTLKVLTSRLPRPASAEVRV
jgi:hypothetical protein